MLITKLVIFHSWENPALLIVLDHITFAHAIPSLHICEFDRAFDKTENDA